MQFPCGSSRGCNRHSNNAVRGGRSIFLKNVVKNDGVQDESHGTMAERQLTLRQAGLIVHLLAKWNSLDSRCSRSSNPAPLRHLDLLRVPRSRGLNGVACHAAPPAPCAQELHADMTCAARSAHLMLITAICVPSIQRQKPTCGIGRYVPCVTRKIDQIPDFAARPLLP